MPNRSSKPGKAREDVNTLAARIVAEATGAAEKTSAPAQKDAAAAALGAKGGTARAATLSKENRSEIAKKAAKARWNKK